ncbi:GIY-YIG nuclease family protein [Burkholderia pseudomallei]|uniref:GIY-YIG nuclease family protein n=1 Tax=Burkholderia pseudomallei TaxID=28450 RepID=UPI00061B9416|nr:GIY-YIG nuclease family protein [Burkholderia pseudomallei]CAJ3147649.1 T5orf172 domain [Burkholderia pseudomallei]CAK0226704.1 meiotically up-regulated [Burkholderia pseudomallei]CAK1291638.1 T5orf172 domain [Burkholderia pseudomallei]VCM82393.1 T5orf172 domain [Burkholderia pseudomallei]
MSNSDLDDLAAELSDFAAPEKKGGRPPREERTIAGFEEIQRFFETHNRAPQHGEDRDIFERLYAVRLDRLRALPDCLTLLAPLDHQGLLADAPSVAATEEAVDVNKLAAELSGMASADDITVLRHVRTSAEKRAAEEIAQRTPCEDFETFKPLFEQVQRELKEGIRETHAFHKLDEIKLAEIQQGEFYIVGGQLAYVAEVGEEIRTRYERRDSRLRVLFDNGTESDVLQRSFQRALYRDEAARLVTNPSAGPLFDDEASEDDQESGTIYVLRSKSDNPVVVANREVLHKIGVTGQSDVAVRFANARNDSTFLLADVEVVATYDLYNINRVKLENLIHRVFDPARLDIEIKDRFGKSVVPREWFLVPVFVVDEAVERIKDGTITGYVYDPKSARLIRE